MKKIPKITHFKKPFTKRLSNLKGNKGTSLSFFGAGLRLMSNRYLTFSQMESARRAISRLVKPRDKVNKKNQKVIASSKKKSTKKKRKKKSKKELLIIRSTLVAPITKKPLQVRMGKGKGSVDSYIYISKASRILLEIRSKKFKLKKKQFLFRKASLKLPGALRFFYKRNRPELYFTKYKNA